MVRVKRVTCVALIATAALFCGMNGCTKKPSQEELSKLEEARSAAESAEKKLAELRQERMRLEGDLANKQTDLKGQENQRDELKTKMGQ